MSPTLEEIAAQFGVNKVTIFGHVKELERKGFLERAAPGISRGLIPVDPSRASVATAGSGASRGHREVGSEDLDAAHSEHGQRSPTEFSILGAIAAGSPIATLEDPESFDLADMLPPGRDVYALRVKGESMIEDGVRDGDVVIVERRETARNGEMVVAVLPDEEATLKRFYKEADRIRLQPANAALSPIFVDDVAIRGVVIGVVRRY